MTYEIINRKEGFSGTPAWPGCGVGTAIGNRSLGMGYSSVTSHQVAYRQLYSTLSHSLQPLVPSCRVSCSRLVPSSFSCHYRIQRVQVELQAWTRW